MTQPSLADVQRWFKSRIQPAPGGADSGAVSPLVGSGQERLAVYTGGYLARYEQALTEAYEALRHIIGREQFHQLTHAYAQRHPSKDYNLSFVGRELTNFLTTYSLSHTLPFLPDLARLEWQVCQAFHAFDQPPMDPAQLSLLSLEEWEKTRLVFQSSVGLVSSAWPILDLWAARTTPRSSWIGGPRATLASPAPA